MGNGFEKHKFTRLDNEKLDSEEVNFLKKQKEGLSNLDTSAVSAFSKDILATNKKSLSNPKVKKYLNRAITHIDQIYKKLFPSWYRMDQNNYFIEKFKAKDSIEQQWILMNMLLAQNIGGGQSYTYATPGGKRYRVRFSPGWFLEKGSGNYMSITTIRMLHKFQSTDANGVTMRSEADCIIGPKTIQQLFSRAGIDFGGLTQDLGVGEVFKTGYSTKKYSLDEAKQQVGQFSKQPVKYAKALVHLYNSVEENDRAEIQRYISALYIQLDKDINSIKDPLERKRVGDSVKRIFSVIPAFRDDNEEGNKLNESIRPKEKLEQLQTIIETADMYIQYLENTLIDKDEYKKIFMIKNMYTKLAILKKKLNNPSTSIINLDLTENGPYLKEIFLDTDDIIISIEGDKLDKDSPGGKQYAQAKTAILFWTYKTKYLQKYAVMCSTPYYHGSAYDELSGMKLRGYDNESLIEIKSMLGNQNINKTTILQNLRNIDKSKNIKYYSGDIIMSKLGIEIAELNLGKKYSALDTDLGKLKDFLEDNDERGGIQGLLEIIQGGTIFGKFRDMEEYAKTQGISDLKETFKKGKEVVKEYLINELSITNDVADKIRDKLVQAYKTIEQQNLPIKEQTKISLRRKYSKDKKKLENNIAYFNKQQEGLNKDSSKYKEYQNKIYTLNKQVGTYNNFISGKNIEVPDSSNNKKKISLDIMANNAYEAANEIAFAQSAESIIGLAILESYEDDVDKIEKLVEDGKGTDDQKKLALIANIEGIGKGRSDKTFNTVIDVTKEIIIQVAIMAVSAGVGNALSTGTRVAISGAGYLIKSSRIGRSMIKFGKMASLLQKGMKAEQLLEAGLVTSRVARTGARAINLISEGIGFHLSSTMLNNVIAGQDIGQGLNPLGYETINGEKMYNWKGYAKSIAFLGVLKNIGKISGNLRGYWSKIKSGNLSASEAKAISTALKSQKFNASQIKTFLNKSIKSVGSVGTEIASLMGTEQILSLAFDQKFTPITGESLIHMVGMVVGLRMHGGMMKKLGAGGVAGKIDNWSIKKFEIKGKDGVLTLINPKTGKEMTIKESEIDAYLKNHISYKNAKGNLIEGEIILQTSSKSTPADGYIMIKAKGGRIFSVKETTLRGNTTLKLDFFTPGNMVYYKNGSGGEVMGEIITKNAKGETAAKDYVMIKTGSNTVFSVKKSTLHNNPDFRMNTYKVGNKIMYKNKLDGKVIEGEIVDGFIDGNGKKFTPKEGDITIKQTNGSYITLSKNKFEAKSFVMVNEFAPGNRIEYTNASGNNVRGTLHDTYTTKQGETITINKGEILFLKEGTGSPIKLSIKTLAKNKSVRVLKFDNMNITIEGATRRNTNRKKVTVEPVVKKNNAKKNNTNKNIEIVDNTSSNVGNNRNRVKSGYTKFMMNKLSNNTAKLPLKNGKHEYKLYDNKGKEINRESLSPKEQVRFTIEAYKKSMLQDVNLLKGMEYVNKTSFAFSKDTKVPGDLDYAITKNVAKTKALFNKLQTAYNKGEIINLKITDKINQSKVIFKFEGNAPNAKMRKKIESMINDKSIRIEYDGLVDVGGGKKVSINREFFVETGKGIFEVDINKYIEVEVSGKKMRFLSKEGYKPYVEDLLVKDLAKDLGSGNKKLKITKRIDDYIDLVTKMEKTRKTTVLTKLKEFIFGKQLSKSKIERMVESLKNSDRYKNKKDPLYKEYEAAVRHFEAILSETISINYGNKELNAGDINKIMNKTSAMKIKIKELGKDVDYKSKVELKKELDVLISELSVYNLLKDAAFPVYHDIYLLTKTKTYDIKIELVENTFSNVNTLNRLYNKIEKVGSIYVKGKEYTPDNLKNIIKNILEGNVDIQYITKQGGLRDKVKELLNDQAVKRNILMSKFEKSNIDREWEIDRFGKINDILSKDINNITYKDIIELKSSLNAFKDNIVAYNRRVSRYNQNKNKISFMKFDGNVVAHLTKDNGTLIVEAPKILKTKIIKTNENINRINGFLSTNKNAIEIIKNKGNIGKLKQDIVGIDNQMESIKVKLKQSDSKLGSNERIIFPSSSNKGRRSSIIDAGKSKRARLKEWLGDLKKQKKEYKKNIHDLEKKVNDLEKID